MTAVTCLLKRLSCMNMVDYYYYPMIIIITVRLLIINIIIIRKPIKNDDKNKETKEITIRQQSNTEKRNTNAAKMILFIWCTISSNRNTSASATFELKNIMFLFKRVTPFSIKTIRKAHFSLTKKQGFPMTPVEGKELPSHLVIHKIQCNHFFRFNFGIQLLFFHSIVLC